MVGEEGNGEKVRQIVRLLPRVNCGHCGFGNCGGFALAVVEGQVSPYGCEVHPLAGDEICKVLGVENPEEVKASSGYFGSSQTGIAASIGMGRGRGHGHHSGHHGRHHGHHSGHNKGGGQHHHHQRYFL